MSEQPQPAGPELTGDDLEAERALELPDRAAMSVIFWHPGTPLVQPPPHDVIPLPPDPTPADDDSMGGRPVSDHKKTDQQGELSQEELQAEGAAELPDREAMSLINANVAAPINAAVAANVLSDGSVAYANAQQTAPITQSTT